MAGGLAAAVLAGCGGDDKNPSAQNQDAPSAESAVTAVIGQLQSAAVAGDGDKICNEIFTPKLADSITKSADSGSCAEEVKANLFSEETKLEVQNVTVTDATNATATIKEANGNVSTVYFARQSGQWRIRSVQPAG